MLEVIGGLLDFVLVVHVAIRDFAAWSVGPDDVEHAVDPLQIHGKAFEPVSDFARDGATIDTAHLLEIGELRDFHAVQPDFPTKTPSAERG